MLDRFWPTIVRINQKYFFDYFAVIIIALSLFSWLQISPTFPEPDSFYHAKMAQLISQGEILHQLPWLQETDLKNIFVDHHFLYHLLLVPFVKFFDPLIGVKIATIIFATILSLAIYWLFKKFQIKWPFIFVILLLTSQPWLFRVSLVKAPAVFLIFFIFAFYALVHQKRFLLFFISLASVWLYAGWPLILVLGGLYLLASYGVNKFRDRQSFYLKLESFILPVKNNNRLKAPIQGLILIVAGLIAGLIVNPYFFSNLQFFWQQFVKIAAVNYQSVIGVGGEWYPYGFIQLAADAPLAMALLIVSLFIFIATFKKQSIFSWVWGVLSIGFFLLTLKSRRYVELYIPFTMIFTAFCWSDLARSQNIKRLWREIGKVWQFVFGIFLSLMAVGFLINIPQDLQIVKRDMANGQPLTHYKNAGQWLKNNASPGLIVFNADWDDFPALLYYNDQNYYLTGLDPTFMYISDKARYEQYVAVTLGRETLDLGYLIGEQFNSAYIFLDNQHRDLNNLLKRQPAFELVFEDSESKIYKFIK